MALSPYGEDTQRAAIEKELEQKLNALDGCANAGEGFEAHPVEVGSSHDSGIGSVASSIRADSSDIGYGHNGHPEHAPVITSARTVSLDGQMAAEQHLEADVRAHLITYIHGKTSSFDF